MIFPQENPLPLQEIAVRLREDICVCEVIPDHLDVSVNTSQTVDESTITLTVCSWPAEIPMLSRLHIFDERRAVLAGLVLDMPKTHHLSGEANLLTSQLQALVDHYQVVVDGKRNFIAEIAFDKRALDAERNHVLQSLKANPETSP